MLVEKNKKINIPLKFGILSVFSAALTQMYLFPLFMMSNIVPFIVSYLYHYEIQNYGNSEIRQSHGYFIHPVMSFFMSISCFYGGIFEYYLGPRISILMGAILLSVGDIFFTLSTNIIVDHFINILFGLGFAVSINSAVKNATKFFPEKKGLINSLVGGLCGNLGSFSFNLIIKILVSKKDYPKCDDNYMYSMSTAKNFKIFFYIHSIITLIFSFLAIISFVPYEKFGNQEVKTINKNNNFWADLKKILVKWRIYRILLIFLCTCFGQGFILTIGFNFGTMKHDSKYVIFNEPKKRIGGDEMSTIFMCMSILSCVSVPFFGMVYDKLKFKKTLLIINLISILNGGLIILTVRLGTIFYGISIIINGLMNSGTFSLIFPYVSEIFGFSYAGPLYGIVVLSTGISSIFSSGIYFLISHIFTQEFWINDFPYFVVFCFGAFCNIISLILIYFENNEKVVVSKEEISDSLNS